MPLNRLPVLPVAEAPARVRGLESSIQATFQPRPLPARRGESTPTCPLSAPLTTRGGFVQPHHASLVRSFIDHFYFPKLLRPGNEWSSHTKHYLLIFFYLKVNKELNDKYNNLIYT